MRDVARTDSAGRGDLRPRGRTTPEAGAKGWPYKLDRQLAGHPVMRLLPWSALFANDVPRERDATADCEDGG